MPLGAGMALSFFAPGVLPPLGARLAILEPFLAGSDGASSLGDVLALPFLLLLSSFGWGEDLVVVFLLAGVFVVEEMGVAILVCGLGPAPPSYPDSDRSSSSCRVMLVLTNRNLSSMERWLPGGGGEEAGLVARVDEVALCFMDLPRHDWPALGEGMADDRCCPLTLLFIPPTTGGPDLIDSVERSQ